MPEFNYRIMQENFQYATKHEANNDGENSDTRFEVFGTGNSSRNNNRKDSPKPTTEECPLCTIEGRTVHMLNYFDHLKCPRCDFIPKNVLANASESGYDGPLPNNMVLDFRTNPDEAVERVSVTNYKSRLQRLLKTY